MNEEILVNLSEQARAYVDTIPYGVNRENEHVWKLCELVVQECMSNLYLHGYDDAMIQIQEHFGVEE
jgi:hypothetical protein